jgi:hypothetical protein
MIDSVNKAIGKRSLERQINGKFQTVLLKKGELNRLWCEWFQQNRNGFSKSCEQADRRSFQTVFPCSGNLRSLRRGFVCGNRATERS